MVGFTEHTRLAAPEAGLHHACITLQSTAKSLSASYVCVLTLKDTLTAAAAFYEVSVCIVQLVPHCGSSTNQPQSWLAAASTSPENAVMHLVAKDSRSVSKAMPVMQLPKHANAFLSGGMQKF